MYRTIVGHALIVVFANAANSDAVVFSGLLVVGSGGVGNNIYLHIDKDYRVSPKSAFCFLILGALYAYMR